MILFKKTMVRHYKRKTDRGSKILSRRYLKSPGRHTAKKFTVKKYNSHSTAMYQYHKGLRKIKSKSQGWSTAIPAKH